MVKDTDGLPKEGEPGIAVTEGCGIGGESGGGVDDVRTDGGTVHSGRLLTGGRSRLGRGGQLLDRGWAARPPTAENNTTGWSGGRGDAWCP